MTALASQLHMKRTRQRIKLPKRAACNYHYEEFSTAQLRAERIEQLRVLKINDGLQKFTSQRDGKIVWMLALPKRVTK